MPWYQLRSGVLYHAVKAVPPGAVLVDDDTAEELIAAGQGNQTEGTEVASGELGADSGQPVDSPRDLAGLLALGEPGGDGQVDGPEGS